MGRNQICSKKWKLTLVGKILEHRAVTLLIPVQMHLKPPDTVQRIKIQQKIPQVKLKVLTELQKLLTLISRRSSSSRGLKDTRKIKETNRTIPKTSLQVARHKDHNFYNCHPKLQLTLYNLTFQSMWISQI